MANSMIKTSALVGWLALSACGGADGVGAEDEVSQSQVEPIINGTSVSADTLGTLKVNSNCSGTLLSDRWLLTAKRCTTVEGVPGGTPLDPETMVVKHLDGSTAHGTLVFRHPSVDVALLRLDQSFLNARSLPFSNPLFLGSATSLVDGSVFCQGWGKKTAAEGTGVLRSAVMTVSSASTSEYQMPANGLAQLLAPGDAGPACFITIDGVRRV